MGCLSDKWRHMKSEDGRGKMSWYLGGELLVEEYRKSVEAEENILGG